MTQIFNGRIRFGVHAGPQHTTYVDYLHLWQQVEAMGYDWASVFDHFVPIQSDPLGPCFEGPTLLAQGSADEPTALRHDRHGQHVPPPGHRGKDRCYARSHLRRTARVGHGRRLAGVGASPVPHPAGNASPAHPHARRDSLDVDAAVDTAAHDV
jgi:hypothetical protein